MVKVVDVQIQDGDKLKFHSGSRVAEVLDHISKDPRGGTGTLTDKNGIATLPGYTLTADAGPYTFRKLPGAVAGAGAGAGAAAVLEHPHRCLTIMPPDDKVSDAYKRVDRLMLGTETIGTCARLDKGLVVVARHCVVSEGKGLKGLAAFGGKLKFLGAKPNIDIAVFEGPVGPHFRLASTAADTGTAVSLLSFPLAYDKELKLDQDNPALDTGVVSQVDTTGRIAMATFSAAMPNSSGGAVLTDTQTLAGVHVGITYHLEELSSGKQVTAGGSSSSSQCAEPPDVLEQDFESLWDVEEEDPISEATTTSAAAQLSRLNIAHKSCAGLFVPAGEIMRCLQALKRAPVGDVEAAGRLKRAVKRLRPAGGSS